MARATVTCWITLYAVALIMVQAQNSTPPNIIPFPRAALQASFGLDESSRTLSVAIKASNASNATMGFVGFGLRHDAFVFSSSMGPSDILQFYSPVGGTEALCVVQGHVPFNSSKNLTWRVRPGLPWKLYNVVVEINATSLSARFDLNPVNFTTGTMEFISSMGDQRTIPMDCNGSRRHNLFSQRARMEYPGAAFLRPTDSVSGCANGENGLPGTGCRRCFERWTGKYCDVQELPNKVYFTGSSRGNVTMHHGYDVASRTWSIQLSGVYPNTVGYLALGLRYTTSFTHSTMGPADFMQFIVLNSNQGQNYCNVTGYSGSGDSITWEPRLNRSWSLFNVQLRRTDSSMTVHFDIHPLELKGTLEVMTSMGDADTVTGSQQCQQGVNDMRYNIMNQRSNATLPGEPFRRRANQQTQCLYGATSETTGCLSCFTGWYGHTCSCSCPTANGVCAPGATHCTSCVPDRYGVLCDKACSCAHGNCSNDPHGTGLCSACHPNFAGPQCTTCDLTHVPYPTCHLVCQCVHGMCDQHSTCSSCAVGYATSTCNVPCNECSAAMKCDEGVSGSGRCVPRLIQHLTATLNMLLADYNQSSFITAIAAQLLMDESHVQVLSVRSGSVLVDFTFRNVDSATQQAKFNELLMLVSANASQFVGIPLQSITSVVIISTSLATTTSQRTVAETATTSAATTTVATTNVSDIQREVRWSSTGGSSTEVTVGVVIGVVGGFLLLIVVGFFILRKYFKKKAQHELENERNVEGFPDGGRIVTERSTTANPPDGLEELPTNNEETKQVHLASFTTPHTHPEDHAEMEFSSLRPTNSEHVLKCTEVGTFTPRNEELIQSCDLDDVVVLPQPLIIGTECRYCGIEFAAAPTVCEVSSRSHLELLEEGATPELSVQEKIM